MAVLLAATATPDVDLSGPLTLLLIVVTVGYLLVCAAFPFRRCRHCGGAGRFHGGFGGIRLCGRCRGTGLRLRAGRRVWNAFARWRGEARRGLRTRDQRRDQ